MKRTEFYVVPTRKTTILETLYMLLGGVLAFAIVFEVDPFPYVKFGIVVVLMAVYKFTAYGPPQKIKSWEFYD